MLRLCRQTFSDARGSVHPIRPVYFSRPREGLPWSRKSLGKAAGTHPSWALRTGRARRAHLGGSQAAFAKRFPAHGSPPDAAKKKRDIGNTWEPVKRVVEDVSLFLLLRSTSTLCTRVGKGKTKTKGKSDSAKGKGSTEVQGIFRMLWLRATRLPGPPWSARASPACRILSGPWVATARLSDIKCAGSPDPGTSVPPWYSRTRDHLEH